jgi:hypothetical protein
MERMEFSLLILVNFLVLGSGSVFPWFQKRQINADLIRIYNTET